MATRATAGAGAGANRERQIDIIAWSFSGRWFVGFPLSIMLVLRRAGGSAEPECPWFDSQAAIVTVAHDEAAGGSGKHEGEEYHTGVYL